MRFAYADPPYPGQARKHYLYDPSRIAPREVNHIRLLRQLEAEYPDGWALSTSAPALPALYFALLADDIAAERFRGPLALDVPEYLWEWCLRASEYLAKRRRIRTMMWVKPFCAFKRGVNPAFAYEPLLVKGGRKRSATTDGTIRDWVSASITLKKGTHGAKPQSLCYWLFDVLNIRPGDTLDDLFPGSGAVTEALATYLGEWPRHRLGVPQPEPRKRTRTGQRVAQLSLLDIAG